MYIQATKIGPDQTSVRHGKYPQHCPSRLKFIGLEVYLTKAIITT